VKINVGGTDGALRIIVGLLLMILAAFHAVGLWGWIGIVPLLTGTFKFCPAYAIFGMSSCPKDKA
jgi:hypothetical protein